MITENITVMKNETYEVYKNQITLILLELKKLNELKGIAGNMDLLDEIRKAYNLLTDLSYDWNTGMEEVYKIWGYYILHSDVSKQEKRKRLDHHFRFLKFLWKTPYPFRLHCNKSDFL